MIDIQPKIILSYNNMEEYMELPVNPSSIAVSQGSNHKTYSLGNLGDVTVLDHLKLREISINSFFPAYRAGYVGTPLGQLDYPWEYNLKILNWRSKLRPIRLCYLSDSVEINMPVSIEFYEYKEVAGSDGDIEFCLKLKEYVFYSVKTIETNAAGDASLKSERPVTIETPASCTVQKGDSLWLIAKQYLGNGSRYNEIAKLNGIANPNLIYAGQTLKLP